MKANRNVFYLDDGVYGEMVDPLTVRLWTERVSTDGDFVTQTEHHEIYLERAAVKALVVIMERREKAWWTDKEPCPVPTDPEQELNIHCAQCGRDIDFRKSEVFNDGVSYVCKRCYVGIRKVAE